MPCCAHAGRIRLFTALALLVSLSLSVLDGCSSRKTPVDPPGLAVLLVFDQMRADYLTRWEKLFGEGGFRRLQQEGAWFRNCHYPYAHTVTGVGHASIMTGCSPDRHGIIDNEWFDRAANKEVGCVQSDRYEQVSRRRATRSGDPSATARGSSPERLLAPTVADVLKQSSDGKSRVVGVSLKDRSAILPVGKKPDACYWFDAKSGAFVTSTYYRDSVHFWAADYNLDHLSDKWKGKQWQRLRTDIDYVRYSGPDDVAGEGAGYRQGRTFPHPFPTPFTAEAVVNSPFGNDLLLGLAERAIDVAQLGHGAARDLITISFSSNDLVGHCWGPDSQEVMDVTLRSDLIVRDLLNFLDAKVGKGNFLVALTADHGVCPLPEVSRQKGLDAQRLNGDTLKEGMAEFLNQKYGQKAEVGQWFSRIEYPWVYLNREFLGRAGFVSSDVEGALADWFRKQPGILAVYTRTQLTAERPPDGPYAEAVRKSFYPDRSGDLYVIQKEYCLFSTPFGTGTTHGAPFDYDTHVPLLVYGPGIRAGVFDEAVTPQAVAAILADRLGISAPEQCEVKVPDSLTK